MLLKQIEYGDWYSFKPMENLNFWASMNYLRSEDRDLFIQFNDRGGSRKKLTITFKGSVCAYRITEESAAHGMLCSLLNRYGDNFIAEQRFFEVRKASYFEDVVRDCYSDEYILKLTHYCFVGTEEFIDVIADSVPSYYLEK